MPYINPERCTQSHKLLIEQFQNATHQLFFSENESSLTDEQFEQTLESINSCVKKLLETVSSSNEDSLSSDLLTSTTQTTETLLDKICELRTRQLKNVEEKNIEDILDLGNKTLSLHKQICKIKGQVYPPLKHKIPPKKE